MTYPYNEISLIQKTYDLYKITYSYSKTFPKSDKYSLGGRIKTLIIEMLELLMEAETAKKDWKSPILEKVSRKLRILKLLVRLTNEIKILDNKKYLVLSEKLQEIGRMLGGWIKAVK